jgi:hypothetical protein
MNKTLQQYVTQDLGYVSGWWRYALLILLFIDALIVTTLAGCYDGVGELGEWYFDLGDRLLMIGITK